MSSSPQLRVEVLMEGFLSKRSPRQLLHLSIDQRRYFILTLSLTSQQVVHCHLSYFRSGDDHIPLGSIPLSSVTRIVPSETDSGRFDIATSSDSRVYSLRCDNASEYSRWMQALQQAKEEEGKTRAQHRTQQLQLQHSAAPSTPSLRSQQQHPPYEQSRHSFSETDSSSRSTGSGDGADAMALLLAGCNVTLVSPPPPSSPASPTLFTPALLQYREDDTALGSLYSISLQSSSSLPAPSRLSLHQLTDIFLGKQSRAWLASASSSSPPAPDCCFSACTRVGISLHVIGERRDVVSIVYGINSVMLSRGQRRIRAKARHGEQHHTHPAAGSSTVVIRCAATPPQHSTIPSSPSSSASSLTRFSTLAHHQATTASSRAVYAGDAALSAAPLRGGRDREMEDWLAGLGGAFAAYCDVFADNGVDLAFLATLSAAELLELGVSRLHAKKIMHAVQQTTQPQRLHDVGAEQQRSAAEPSRLTVRASVAAAEAFSSASTATSTPSSAPVSSSVFPSALRSDRSAACARADSFSQKADMSSLLAALPSSSSSPFFPPPPMSPQETRRDSYAAFHSARFGSETKRGSLESAMATARMNSVKESSRRSTAGASMQTYLGGVFSALKAGSSSHSVDA